MPDLRLMRRRRTAERSFVHRRSPEPQNNVPPIGPVNNDFSLPANTIVLTFQSTVGTSTPPLPPPPPTSTTPLSVPPVTPLVPPTTSPTSPQISLSPPPVTTRPPTSPTASVIPQRTTGSTPPPSGNNSSADLAPGSTTKSIPAGAIVGIVIAGVIILLIAVVLLVRRSFQQNRVQKRATWLNQGVSNKDMTGIGRAGMVTGGTVSTFAPQEQSAPYPSQMPSAQFGASVIPAAGAASMALANVAVADPGGGETSPGYAFATAQAKALATAALAAPAASYNNPSAPVSPRTIPENIGLDGDKAVVKFTFIPTLPDELSISNGEIVTVLQEYDDGWTLCLNGRGVQGMVPLECLDRGDPSANSDQYTLAQSFDGRSSRRASSLNIIGTSISRR